MTVSIFLTFPEAAGSDAGAALESRFTAGPLDDLRSAAGLRFVDTYRPAPGGVPQFQEGPGPGLLIELNLDTIDAAQALLGSPALRAAADGRATADVFHAVHFPLPGHVTPPPRTAALSFVVRYYRPAPDEAAFVAFYTAHHPLLLARFPAIRNVLCYLPTGLELPDHLEASGAFFGNEVVFDDLESLNRALASDVLPELRAEGRLFPPFGHSSHHAMLRRTVHPRGA